jgi:hypothetical protein
MTFNSVVRNYFEISQNDQRATFSQQLANVRRFFHMLAKFCINADESEQLEKRWKEAVGALIEDSLRRMLADSSKIVPLSYIDALYAVLENFKDIRYVFFSFERNFVDSSQFFFPVLNSFHVFLAWLLQCTSHSKKFISD